MSTSRRAQINKLLKSSKPFFVVLRFSGDTQIKKLNKKYLSRDFTTDVLSFPIDQQTEDGFYLGDVAINIDQAKRQAKDYGNSHEEEIAELAGHGVLHLLEVHHPDDDTKTIHGQKVK